MKIRTGFVSNSSSTSFIIISDSCNEDPKNFNIKDKTLKISGFYEFGWNIELHYDFNSKAAFCYLQCKDNSEHLNLLNAVIIDYLGCSKVIWDVDNDSYIDHQSMYTESSVFKFKYNFIKHFLFSTKSFLQMGSDN